eukprot:1360798-Amphidinium_carterae.1
MRTRARVPASSDVMIQTALCRDLCRHLQMRPAEEPALVPLGGHQSLTAGTHTERFHPSRLLEGCDQSIASSSLAAETSYEIVFDAGNNKQGVDPRRSLWSTLESLVTAALFHSSFVPAFTSSPFNFTFQKEGHNRSDV